MYNSIITDDMSELEKSVRRVVDDYVNAEDDSFRNDCVTSIVGMGKDVIPYIMKLIEENGGNTGINVYSPLFIEVMNDLYGNPFTGYSPREFRVRYWMKRYEHDMLEDYDENTDKTKETEFLMDLLQCDTPEELEKYKMNS